LVLAVRYHIATVALGRRASDALRVTDQNSGGLRRRSEGATVPIFAISISHGQ
jgi:hypothetical protein